MQFKIITIGGVGQGLAIQPTTYRSGGILASVDEMGFEFMGFEIDKDYYNKSSNRLDKVKSQLNMFEII